MKIFVWALPALIACLIPVQLLAKAPKCHVCSMGIDDAHNVHYRYQLEGGTEVHLGSLSCSKKYWQNNKKKNMRFEAKDFVTGKYVDAQKGFFVVGSKLNAGTGMDKTSVVFVVDEALAQKLIKANGGKKMHLKQALLMAVR